MKMFQFFLYLLIFNSCTEDIAEDALTNNLDELTEEGVNVYDENSIPSNQEEPANLLSAGDFENQNDWSLCGDVQISSENVQGTTNNYLSLSTTSLCEELSSDFIDVHGFVYHPLNISEIPDKLYITLDARTSKEILSYTFDTNFKIGFLDERFFTTDYFGAVDFINYFKSQLDESWSRIEIVANKNDIIGGLGEGVLPSYIFIELGSNENVTLDIDNISVTTTSYKTPISPMPIELRNNLYNDRFVFTNIDETTAAIADVNGTNMISLSDVSTEVLSSFPTWYDNSHLLLAEKNFNPPSNTDGTTISAAQSQLYKIGFDGRRELLYETLGNPGIFEYDGSVNNREALDIEIDRAFWNTDLNLGLLTICAQNRSLGFVSDDYCKLIVIDENGNEVATMRDDDTGFHGVWSSNGKIAYIWHDALYTAEIAGTEIIPTQVYTSRATLQGAVEWSPDNNSLAFIETGGKFIDFNGSQIYANGIKVLDLNTGKKREITLVDFGEIDPMLSWSNDGRYIFYSVRLLSGQKQIWWSEVATGATGPITNTINAFAATVLKK